MNCSVHEFSLAGAIEFQRKHSLAQMNPLCLSCLVEFHQSGRNKWAGFWHQGLTPFKKCEFVREHFRGCPAIQALAQKEVRDILFSKFQYFLHPCCAPFLQRGYMQSRVKLSHQDYLKYEGQNQVPAANFGCAVSTSCHASSILQRRFCRHT